VNAELPAIAEVVEIEVNIGAGLPTVNVCVEEPPPPGAVLKTVMLSIPTVDRTLDGICVLSVVLLI